MNTFVCGRLNLMLSADASSQPPIMSKTDVVSYDETDISIDVSPHKAPVVMAAPMIRHRLHLSDKEK